LLGLPIASSGMQNAMPIRPVRALTFILCGASLLLCTSLRAAAPAWVEKSNQNTQLLLNVTSRFQPEGATFRGLEGYDDKVSDLLPGNDERLEAALVGVREELQKRLDSEADPAIRQDLEILIKSASNQLETEVLTYRLTLSYTDVGQLIFYGEFGLLQEQTPASKHPSALGRLKRYTGIEPGYTPITELAKARYLETAADPARIGPYRNEVEQHLSNIARYTDGVRKLFTKYGLDKAEGAPAALDALDKQMADYGAWVRATVLPRARKDFRLPPELYANSLKNVGMDLPPQELMQKAEVAFTELRNEMQALAVLVAKEHGFKDSDYRAVIHDLKKEQLGKDEVMPWYREVLTHIEENIRSHRIATLPDRPMEIRMASEAESAGEPAPHMQPPPLINNKGERGTFVLSMGNPQAAGMKTDAYDDFTFKAAAWTLTSHEGRPGHELQFSAMVERGVSLARSIFAFNSVNVEGWALYCEAEMKPYEPLDGQLIALQHRLMRATRAFVDPMLNLGLISKERVHDILVNDVCLSEALAREEVDRYTFNAPGQATSYFYGYQKLMELRTTTEVALGSKFDRLAFNDFVVGQGLLPPDLLAKAVNEEFIPSQSGK